MAHQQRLTNPPVSLPPSTNPPPSPSESTGAVVEHPTAHPTLACGPVCHLLEIQTATAATHLFHYLSSSPAEDTQTSHRLQRPDHHQSPIPPIHPRRLPPTGQGENLFFASQQRFATAAPANTAHNCCFVKPATFFYHPPHCRRGLLDSNKAPTSPGPGLRLSCFHRGRASERACCNHQPRTAIGANHIPQARPRCTTTVDGPAIPLATRP